MIYDKLSELGRYRGLSPELDTAIAYILKNRDSLAFLPLGKTCINGDRVFVNVVKTQSQPIEAGAFEYHRHYIDLHIDLSGTEILAAALTEPTPTGPYDEAGDGGLCAAEGGPLLPLGDAFALVFPGEPHQPLIAVKDAAPVHKCIFKIYWC